MVTRGIFNFKAMVTAKYDDIRTLIPDIIN